MSTPIRVQPGTGAGGRWLLPVLLFGVTLCSFVVAAERPRIYAITGATVVPAPGRVVESGTVLIRDGLIEAVGGALTIPADAVEIDATDRYVYPGLIDADSSLGIRSSGGEGRGPAAGGAGGAPAGFTPRRGEPAGAVHPLPLIRAETAARDLLLPFRDDRRKEVERIRNLGFTVVHATPESGILRGTSAAILLADDRPVAELILRDDVAQHASFERGRFGQGYPTSLMGSVAALRQALLDADRHREWSARYAANPQGMRRPEQHATFVALAPVLEGDQRLIFHTDAAHDTLLADNLAREFGLDVAISTSSHEWEMADRLAEAGRTLIVSLAFPDKPDVKEDDEALEASIDEMRRFLDAAAGPARLHEAGVQFALTLQGLKNSADFRKHMRKIIGAGLPDETALAALTTVPAQLLGIDPMVGTLEPGKIANLIVADGPLFAEETKLRQIFVDGVDYEIEVKEKPTGDPNAVVDPRGQWSVAFDFGRGTVERSWTIEGEPGSYSGTAETRAGTVTFDSVELAGNVLTVVFPGSGGRPPMEISVIIEGDSFEGSAEMGPRTIELTGTRTSGPGGGVR